VRRLSLPWVLSLLLVFAQHGAVLHELGHLSHGGEHGARAALIAQQTADSNTCPTCEAFAQVANPAGGNASTLAASVAVYLPTPAPVLRVIAADTLTPRSRGPPQA